MKDCQCAGHKVKGVDLSCLPGDDDRRFDLDRKICPAGNDFGFGKLAYLQNIESSNDGDEEAPSDKAISVQLGTMAAGPGESKANPSTELDASLSGSSVPSATAFTQIIPVSTITDSAQTPTNSTAMLPKITAFHATGSGTALEMQLFYTLAILCPSIIILCFA